MADEVSLNYNDIDSGKLLNKAGLLELSGQIKGYIQANMGSGGTTPTIYYGSYSYHSLSMSYRATFDATTQAWLDSCITDPSNIANGILVMIDVSNRQALAHIDRISEGKMVITVNEAVNNIELNPTSNAGSSTYRIQYPDKIKIPSQAYCNMYFGEFSAVDVYVDSTTAYNNVEKSLRNELRQLKNYYATKTELPQIPANPTTDGTYVLVSTVSSGTATRTWENVIIGGSY